jgi:lipooligosaccharide transport system permease protein
MPPSGTPSVDERSRRGWKSDVTVTAVASGLRIVPAAALEVRRPQRMIERSAMVNRRTWLIMFSGFFEPLFYLMSIRIGVGELIGDVTVGGVTVDYAEFVAPALLAAAAMNGAIYETTMNVFFKMKYERLYDTVLATPMSPADVALGEIGWAVIRGGLYSAAFLVTMAVLGMTASPWVVLALPFSLLIAFAFASTGMAITTYMRSWVDFEYVTAATLPLFLFSATFYPVSSYGEWGWIVQLSPLYHGVALVRSANTGEFGWATLGHVAVLVVLTLGGLLVAARRIRTLLLK